MKSILLVSIAGLLTGCAHGPGRPVQARPAADSTDPKDVQLLDAVARGDVAAAKAALAAGGKTTATKGGLMPLHTASAWGNLEIMSALLAAGAEVNAPSGDGLKMTPLMWASMWGQPEAAKVLLAAKADVNAKALRDAVAIHHAAGIGGKVALVKLLIDAGAQAAATDLGGQSALHVLCSFGKTPAENAADISQRRTTLPVQASNPVYAPYFSQTAADFSERAAIAQLLLDAGVPADGVSKGDTTPLSLCANHGFADVIKVLAATKKVDLDALHHGFDGAVVGGMGGGGTALMYAAGRGHLAAVQALVEAGVNLNKTFSWSTTSLEASGTGGTLVGRTTTTHTALSVASAMNHPDVVAYLRAHGAKGPNGL